MSVAPSHPMKQIDLLRTRNPVFGHKYIVNDPLLPVKIPMTWAEAMGWNVRGLL